MGNKNQTCSQTAFRLLLSLISDGVFIIIVLLTVFLNSFLFFPMLISFDSGIFHIAQGNRAASLRRSVHPSLLPNVHSGTAKRQEVLRAERYLPVRRCCLPQWIARIPCPRTIQRSGDHRGGNDCCWYLFVFLMFVYDLCLSNSVPQGFFCFLHLSKNYLIIQAQSVDIDLVQNGHNHSHSSIALSCEETPILTSVVSHAKASPAKNPATAQATEGIVFLQSKV